MEKHDVDELYHLLRVAFNEGNRQQSTEITDAIYGLASHLLAGKDYLRLIQYSAYYGRKYLLQPTFCAIVERGWRPLRFVEFGAGLGWLSRGLASKFEIKEVLTIDKRPWAAIDLVADLELGSGMRVVHEQLKQGDVIVMSDFLHCVENPEGILKAFSEYPIAILEYMPTDEAYAESFKAQLTRYHGTFTDQEDLVSIFMKTGRPTDCVDLDSYVLTLIDKEA